MLKLFIKEWLLPLWIYDILYYWVVGTIMGRCGRTISQLEKQHATLFILANGPSLKSDIEKYKEKFSESDLLVVNQFCQSEYFTIFKPRIYLLVDPKYFDEESAVEDNWKPRIKAVKDVMRDIVNWDMYLVLPYVQRNSDVAKIAHQNKHIKVLFYNNRPSRSEADLMFLLSRNMIAPPSASVVNVATYLGVYWRYGMTILIGADTSSHCMMVVDQQTNEMFLEEEHFYGKVRRPFYLNNEGTIRATAADWLDMAARVFRGYQKVVKMAKYMGVQLFNASSNSWIDSIERYKG